MTNNAFLSKIIEADSLLAHVKGSWTFEGKKQKTHSIPGADVHVPAIMSLSKIDIDYFEP